LKKRGIGDAEKMGQFLTEKELIPDTIIASTARRAMETARIMSKVMGLSARDINYDPSLYLCQPHTFINVLENVSSLSKRAMIVGHNPSMDYMVQWLSQKEVQLRADGKLMTTTSVAHFKMPDIWCPLQAHVGELCNLWRPKELPLK